VLSESKNRLDVQVLYFGVLSSHLSQRNILFNLVNPFFINLLGDARRELCVRSRIERIRKRKTNA
jgi:hypothetical protein